jgi:hypothetical protein
VPWVPPLPEEGELLDEHALATIARAVIIERIERMRIMDVSLLAEPRSKKPTRTEARPN